MIRQREHRAKEKKRVETRPLQLQRTGAGVVIGLADFIVLVFALWWWQGQDEAASTPVNSIGGPAPAAEGTEVNDEN